MSGTVAVVAKGQGGQCIIGRDSSGGNSFGWAGREADFPGLGDSLTLEEPPGTDDIDAKWAIRQGLAFFGTLTTGYTFSDDHKSLSIDVDFPPSGTATEHIKGSITCP